MTPSERLAAVLKQHRLAHGLTQRELAARAGVSPLTVGEIERAARSNYRHLTLTSLATALHLPRDALRSVFDSADFDCPEPQPDPDSRTPVGTSLPVSWDVEDSSELAALHGKLDKLAPEDREVIENMIDRLLDD